MEGNKGIDLHGTTEVAKQRRNRVLLIGIDRYAHWDNLEYPVSDCEQFWDLLKTHYGFQDEDIIHEPVFNEKATLEVIDDELRWFLRDDENGHPNISPDDNLILYFSGHGHLDKETGEGYWVPADAHQPNGAKGLNELLAVNQVVNILNKVKAYHVVLIIDACFSGTFTRMTVEVPPGGDPNNPEEKPSRWALTAGRLETVLDKSPFAEAVRNQLIANTRSRLSIQTLGTSVKDLVAETGKQTPACISLVDQKYEGGEFFFHRITTVQLKGHENPPIESIVNLSDRLRQGSTVHLDRLKKGRFKLLRIEKLLLTSANLPDFIDTKVKSGAEETPLQQAVNSLWGKEKPHAVVLGEGGMGKTVSLVRLWEDLLNGQPSSIPIFVALNEYNAVSESEKHDFVLRSIARNCGLAEALTDDLKNALWDFIKAPLPDGSPAILLLLDGFNEVTVKKDQLLIDLNRLAEQTKGMQMVITSRYVEIQNFTWAQHSEVVELLPLPFDKIEAYLGDPKVNVPIPVDEGLRKLFTNPMMLTLYAGSSSIARKYEGDKRFRFLPTGSYGELLWNFNEAQLAKHLEDCEHDLEEQIWHIFLLRCLVPALAYRMEEEGQFFIPTRKALNPAFNFKSLLDEAFMALNREELTEVFPDFEGKRSLLGLGELLDMDAREQRALKVRQYLVEKLHLLVAEDEALRFVHQNFRDFYAACHLRNVAEMGLVRGELPEVWKERAFPVYLRRMLGEIEGEHYVKPFWNGKTKMVELPLHKNIIARLLTQCRGVFEEASIRFAVWNLVKIMAEGRGTLAGADLRRLNLLKFNFNGILLYSHKGVIYTPAILEGSLLNGGKFIFHGHTTAVYHAVYSPDGLKILSTSASHLINEWSTETGEWLKTYKGHSEKGRRAFYSVDGKKIISIGLDKKIEVFDTNNTSDFNIVVERESRDNLVVINTPWHNNDYFLSIESDNTIKVFVRKTGECLQVLYGHSDMVFDAIFSIDQRKVLSASSDSTIREWLIDTGECLQIFNGEWGAVLSVAYSRDGKKIFSGHTSGELREWSVETGNCLRTINAHSSGIMSVAYSNDGKKLLSAGGSDLKEWLVETGKCLRIFDGKGSGIWSVMYSPDKRKILAASLDGTATEWSLFTGLCLQSMVGHSGPVTCAVYSPNGEDIVSASKDQTLKKWATETGECIQTFGEMLEFHGEFFNLGIRSVVYSPNGKKLLFGSFNGVLKELSAETGDCLQVFDDKVYGLIKLAKYSPNGEKILSSSSGAIIEWCVKTGEIIKKFFYTTKRGQASSCSYSPDGKKVIAAFDKDIVEWSLITGEQIQIFQEHTVTIWHLDYSHDGKRIISAGETVKEWSVQNGTCLQTYEGHEIGVKYVAYNSDGTKFISASFDDTIKEWSTETGKCLRTFPTEPGLFVQSVDFRHLHPSSQFTEEEKDRLRRYGAIFNDEDERRWKEAVEDAYGKL